MAETGKKVEVRYGAFACTIEGYDNPVEQLRGILGEMQQMIAATPQLTPIIEGSEAEEIEEALDTNERAEDPSPGIVVIRDGAAAATAAARSDDASDAEEVPWATEEQTEYAEAAPEPDAEQAESDLAEDAPTEHALAGEELEPSERDIGTEQNVDGARTDLEERRTDKDSLGGISAAAIAATGLAIGGAQLADAFDKDDAQAMDEPASNGDAAAEDTWSLPSDDVAAEESETAEEDSQADALADGLGRERFSEALDEPVESADDIPSDDDPTDEHDPVGIAEEVGVAETQNIFAGPVEEATYSEPPLAEEDSPGGEDVHPVSEAEDTVEDVPNIFAPPDTASPAVGDPAFEGAAESEFDTPADYGTMDLPQDATPPWEEEPGDEQAAAAHENQASDVAEKPLENAETPVSDAVNVFATPPEDLPESLNIFAAATASDDEPGESAGATAEVADVPAVEADASTEPMNIFAAPPQPSADPLPAPPPSEPAQVNIFAAPSASDDTIEESAGATAEVPDVPAVKADASPEPMNIFAAPPQPSADPVPPPPASEPAQVNIFAAPPEAVAAAEPSDIWDQATETLANAAPENVQETLDDIGSTVAQFEASPDEPQPANLTPDAPTPAADEQPKNASSLEALTDRVHENQMVAAPGEPGTLTAVNQSAATDVPALPNGIDSPATLANRAGCDSVSDLLAASAAWLTLAQNKTRFSRREVMDVFETIPGDHPRTLEARIKGYGRLVRSGMLVLVDDGVFAIAQTERDRFQTILDAT